MSTTVHLGTVYNGLQVVGFADNGRTVVLEGADGTIYVRSASVFAQVLKEAA